MKHVCAVVFISIIFSSCKKETVERNTISAQHNYFPLKTGQWITYSVDSVAHLEIDDGTNEPDTSKAYFHFNIKEVVESSFIDATGSLAYHIFRYRQINDTMPWVFASQWVALNKPRTAERVEANIRYIKLAFPIDYNSTWNGNAYNDLGEEEYAYTVIDEQLAIGSYNFDSTLTVLQVDETNFLYRIYKEEKFASQVGMVYKQKDSLNFNGFQQITNGYEYRETVLSFGN